MGQPFDIGGDHWITGLCKPLIGKTSYHLKNTATFSKELKDLWVEEDEIMNYHGVVSLFTNVAHHESLGTLQEKARGGQDME